MKTYSVDYFFKELAWREGQREYRSPDVKGDFFPFLKWKTRLYLYPGVESTVKKKLKIQKKVWRRPAGSRELKGTNTERTSFSIRNYIEKYLEIYICSFLNY